MTTQCSSIVPRWQGPFDTPDRGTRGWPVRVTIGADGSQRMKVTTLLGVLTAAAVLLAMMVAAPA